MAGSRKFKWFSVVTSQMSATSGKGVNNELFMRVLLFVIVIIIIVIFFSRRRCSATLTTSVRKRLRNHHCVDKKKTLIRIIIVRAVLRVRGNTDGSSPRDFFFVVLFFSYIRGGSFTANVRNGPNSATRRAKWLGRVRPYRVNTETVHRVVASNVTTKHF